MCAGYPQHAPLFVNLPSTRVEDFRGMRLFIYDLPSTFNSDLLNEMEELGRQEGSGCDFMRSPCTESKWAGKYSVKRQHGAEVIILRKLLASGTVVRDPHQADLFVVPYLAALDCTLGGAPFGCKERRNHRTALFGNLTYYNHASRLRHLFLGSMNMVSLPLEIQAQFLIASDGASWGNRPGHIVVPASASEVETQPKNLEDVSFEDRDFLFWLVQTPNNAVRAEVHRQLIDLQGRGKQALLRLFNVTASSIHLVATGRESMHHLRPSSADMIHDMKRSVFCPALPAETSGGTIRLLDAIRAGCLPVVISFKTSWGSGISWWRSDGAPVEWSLPFAWEIDWRRLAVEVPHERLYGSSNGFGGFVHTCSLLSTTDLKLRLDYLYEVRPKLLYDLDGGSLDAFSIFMNGLRSVLQKIGPNPTTVASHRPLPLVCDTMQRLGHLRTLPKDPVIGMGLGNEKRWSHSFGEFSCTSADQWRMPAEFLDSIGNALPLIVERSIVSRMFQSVHGTHIWLRRLIRTEVAHADHAAVFAGSFLSSCQHRYIPQSCHDLMTIDENGLEIVKCPPTKSQRHVRTNCRLIPAALPHANMPPSPVQVTMQFEMILTACSNSTSLESIVAEFDKESAQLPAHLAVHLVVYEACGAESAAVWFDHILATMHQLYEGRDSVDALLFLSGDFAVIPPKIGMSRVDLGRVIASVATGIVDVLRADGDSFNRWFHVMSLYKAPQALAFPTAILRRAEVVQWEVAVNERFFSEFRRRSVKAVLGDFFQRLFEIAQTHGVVHWTMDELSQTVPSITHPM